MSAPMRLSPVDLRDVASALDAYSKARSNYGVKIHAYGPAEIRHLPTDTTLAVRVDDDGDYFIDDRNGS